MPLYASSLSCTVTFQFSINMLVKRNLYMASLSGDLAKEVVMPQVQSRHSFSGTPRIVFWRTPSAAISALGPDVSGGQVIYLYSPLTTPHPDSVHEPTPLESPLFCGLGEVWYLTTTRLGEPTPVRIGHETGRKTLTFYNPRRNDFIWKTWSWEELGRATGKMSKAVYLSRTDLGLTYTARGTLKEGLGRSLSAAVEGLQPGEYYRYKPVGDVKIPLDRTGSWTGATLELVRIPGIVLVKGGGQYETR